MAQFPRTEAQVVVLAQQMVTGLSANVVIYPNPPVTTPTLQTALTAFTAARLSSSCPVLKSSWV